MGTGTGPGERLPLATSAQPAVSLVMVLYGGYEVARRALVTVGATADVDYEVIVVDNASPDGAGRRLRDEVDGARFVLNEDNVGFGAAVDVGALRARGRYLGILNSDIEPEPGWLSALVGVLDGDDGAGAATPRYLGADGAVQEAGVVVGADGRGYGYGDRLDDDDPRLGFRRDVDYGSAAALVVRREAFERVGGLDPVYGLGYFEDADLGFSLREIGLRTVYEPSARVRHLGQGAFSHRARRRLLARNRHIFVDRFAGQLAGRPLLRRPPFDPHRDLVVRDWWAEDRLLVIDASGALAPVATAAHRALPRSRVTWVAAGAGADGVLGPGVERFDDVGELGAFLERRRFHYGAVITDAVSEAHLRPWLRHSQSPAVVGVMGASADGTTPAGTVALAADAPIEVTLPRLGLGA
ncbi:MAG: glycosyltransferase family 2 protein [Acidimicrobiia bacterium]